jgi:hypothetical protein
MTESEWLYCDDSWPMLEWVASKASERKLRLFACACFQHVHNPMDRGHVRVWGIALCHADGQATDDELMGAGQPSPYRPNRPAQDEAFEAIIATGDALDVKFGLDEATGDLKEEYTYDRSSALLRMEHAAQAALLRDIIGNPFRPLPPLSPSLLDWHGGAVLKLAHAIYEERSLPEGTLDRARLAVLADMLEEAGCCDEQLLSHLRGQGPHVRGCVAVDSILGRT